jgi:mannose/fructose-specific phosphotransferase system component IIA
VCSERQSQRVVMPGGVEIFSGDSIPMLLRLASEAQSRSNLGKQEQKLEVTRSKSRKLEETHEKQKPADLPIFTGDTFARPGFS